MKPVKTAPIRETANAESGIFVVFLALVLPALLIVIGAAINTGFLYFARTQAQAAVDAAALAAAAGVPHYRMLDKNDTRPGSQMVTNLATLLSNENGILHGDADLRSTDISYFLRQWNGTTFVYSTPPRRENYSVNGVKVQQLYSVTLPFPLLSLFTISAGQASMNQPGGGNVGQQPATKAVNLRVNASAVIGGSPNHFFTNIPIALMTCIPRGTNWDLSLATACNQSWFIDTVNHKDLNSDLALTLNPSVTDSASWYSPEPRNNLDANECSDFVNSLVVTTSLVRVNDLIDLNNGNLTSCLHDIEDKIAAYGTVDSVLPVVNCEDFPNTTNPVHDAPVRGLVHVGVTRVNTGSRKGLNFQVYCNSMQSGASPIAESFNFFSAPYLVE